MVSWPSSLEQNIIVVAVELLYLTMDKKQRKRGVQKQARTIYSSQGHIPQ
jgi:hypothetical protein